ncbi:MAG: hypothetical protein RL332_907 [Actinomycetota bacterium]
MAQRSRLEHRLPNRTFRRPDVDELTLLLRDKSRHHDQDEYVELDQHFPKSQDCDKINTGMSLTNFFRNLFRGGMAEIAHSLEH